MTSYEIVTTMNERIYQQTGRQMLQAIRERWPRYPDSLFETTVYWEQSGPPEETHEHRRIDCLRLTWSSQRIYFWDQLAWDDDLREFLERNEGRDDPKRMPRFGASRFAYKSFAVCGRGETTPADVMIWMDADVFTYRQITEKQLEEWLPEDADIAILGREGGYTETGFVMYRPKRLQKLFQAWKRTYLTDQVFNLHHWHDCWVMDRALEKLPKVKIHNLTPWGRKMQHVFINGPLGAYMDHLKGPRKVLGKSKPSDLLPCATPEIREWVGSA